MITNGSVQRSAIQILTFSKTSTPIQSFEVLSHIEASELKRNELRHTKNNKISVRPLKTQISLGICPAWSASLLSAWRNFRPLATHWVHSEDSDQTGWIPRLIWVFAESTHILLVLSCRSSNIRSILGMNSNMRLYIITWSRYKAEWNTNNRIS